MTPAGVEPAALTTVPPTCLKVDKAIIFSKSYSKFDPRPAVNIVNPEINKKTFNKEPKEGKKVT